MPWCSRRFERWGRQRSRWDSSPDRSGGDATTLLIQKQAGTRSSIQSAVHRPVMIWARMPIEFAVSHEPVPFCLRQQLIHANAKTLFGASST